MGKDKYRQFAIDIFAFTYYIGGINFVDIANLTVKNIQDGFLLYDSSHTFLLTPRCHLCYYKNVTFKRVIYDLTSTTVVFPLPSELCY